MNGIEAKIQQIRDSSGQLKSTITLNINAWNELKSYIDKASALVVVGAQYDFGDKTFENFMWALSDYVYNAEKLMNAIDSSLMANE